jgi:hypothetical protein
MAVPDRRIEASESHRTLIIVVAVIAAVAIAGLFYGLMRFAGGGQNAAVRLQGGFRAGSPQFEANKPNIVLDDPEATEAKRALGDITMTLTTTARNLTGKTLSGLEIHAAVVDYEGRPVKERTVVVIPSQLHPELPPNKTLQVNVGLDGMSDTDARANIKMDVTAFKFKE